LNAFYFNDVTITLSKRKHNPVASSIHGKIVGWWNWKNHDQEKKNQNQCNFVGMFFWPGINVIELFITYLDIVELPIVKLFLHIFNEKVKLKLLFQLLFNLGIWSMLFWFQCRHFVISNLLTTLLDKGYVDSSIMKMAFVFLFLTCIVHVSCLLWHLSNCLY